MRPKHPSALAYVAQTFRHVLWDLEFVVIMITLAMKLQTALFPSKPS